MGGACEQQVRAALDGNGDRSVRTLGGRLWESLTQPWEGPMIGGATKGPEVQLRGRPNIGSNRPRRTHIGAAQPMDRDSGRSGRLQTPNYGSAGRLVTPMFVHTRVLGCR